MRKSILYTGNSMALRTAHDPSPELLKQLAREGGSFNQVPVGRRIRYRFLYGGSVDSSNINDYLSSGFVDGVLVLSHIHYYKPHSVCELRVHYKPGVC